MAKITLFLMTKKGFKVLEHILASKLESLVDLIVVGKDRKTRTDYSKEIIALCQEANLKWCYRKEVTAVTTPFSIAISWRWMIRNSNSKLIVLHDSILPKYRGFAPLVNQLINGEKKIGVTALFASSEYDKGPVIGQKSIAITYPIKIETAIDRVAVLYAKLIEEIILTIQKGDSLPETQQDETKASYSLWRDEEDYRIDWSYDAGSILRHINAVGFPYFGALTRMGTTDIRIIDAEVINDVKIEVRQPGKVVFIREERPVIVCGVGLIKITSAYYDENGASIFPLKKFRIRFQ